MSNINNNLDTNLNSSSTSHQKCDKKTISIRDYDFDKKEKKSLNGIEQIKGSLLLHDSELVNLGDLKEITYSLAIYSNTIISRITTLGKLERVGKNIRLRYSNIVDLGQLKEVGGSLNLRDTKIDNLGSLKYVGKNLFLPVRLRGEFDLSKITIKGKVSYWHDIPNEKKVIKQKEESGLITYQNDVPTWKDTYIYSNDLKYISKKKKEFYTVFKQNFLDGNFLDLEGNNNYSFILLFDLLSEDDQQSNFKVLQKHLENLGKYYPKTESYAQQELIEKIENAKDYESAWNLSLKYNKSDKAIDTILDYEFHLKRTLLTVDHIVSLSGISHLSKLGKKNIESIKPFVKEMLERYEKENGKRFFEIFFTDGKPYKRSKTSSQIKGSKINTAVRKVKFKNKPPRKYNPCYYKQFYLDETYYYDYKAIDESQDLTRKNYSITHVIYNAIKHQCRLILKKAEVLYCEPYNRWITKFTELKKSFDKDDSRSFIKGVLLLEAHNKNNPNIDLIFYEAAKFIAKYEKKLSIQYYLKYIFYNIKLKNFNNKPLSNTILKLLFEIDEQLSDFQDIVNTLKKNMDIEKALYAISNIYIPKRKKIVLDKNKIEVVTHNHSETVKLLNEYLDKVEIDNKGALGADVGILRNKTTFNNIPQKVSIFISNLNFSEIQEFLLKQIAENSFSISQKKIADYALKNGMFKNQLIDSINDVCCELLDGEALIEEDEDSYVIEESIYNSLIKK